ncbi:hypothetical protein HUG17_2713 [Dermatophagoides farinae]|uniref:BTB domain-containing protein n=1 Tax=Dermatophagoides farinae TaxID=6954 RepID=A0A9D4SF33_DERFA|nr:ankyrin repeat and BTB/POZ domain-containing protein 1-like [Dermatophagoides farinae]KAH7638680.1 hypothetical protein HUG17_2713 [Dermatophagoides farinae]
MDISRMFRACKLGDFETLKTLIETKDVDVNFRDKFDSTPLYYACLCGHLNVVRFLLEHGAKCDIKTFDGERCVYGALTDDIRKLLLKEYKIISKKVIRRNDYDEFLRKSLDNSDYADVIFYVHQKTFKAHRYILMIRSEYFRQKFIGKWKDRNVIHIKNEHVNPDAFKILLHFLYTGILEFSYKIRDDVCRLFRQCQMEKINDMIECRIQELQKQLRSSFRQKNVTIYMDFPILFDYRKLFQTTLPMDLIIDQDENFDINVNELKILQMASDVVFRVQNHLFYCHKLFFAGRSDYFAALFRDHFGESDTKIPTGTTFTINDRADLFRLLICFLYTNDVDITLDQACDLLYASDVYLIESLKRHCATVIGNNIAHFNPIDIIKWSRVLNLSKLEAIATQYIAENLKQFIHHNDFKQLVIEDAHSVRQRQETDTIDIIDDIRYYLSICSTKKDIQSELLQIDLLLESLQLDA